MKKIRIGIPKNEGLYPAVEAILTERGIWCSSPSPKRLSWETDHCQFVLGSVADIARMTASRHLDCAFVTRDHWREQQLYYLPGGFSDSICELEEFSSIGRCDLVFAAKEGSHWTQKAQEENSDVKGIIRSLIFRDERSESWKPVIATRFPRITSYYIFRELHFDDVCEELLRGILKEVKAWRYHPTITEVRGDEEVYVLTGRADLAMVQVETGETLRQNGLVPIKKISTSHLILVGSKDLPMTALF